MTRSSIWQATALAAAVLLGHVDTPLVAQMKARGGVVLAESLERLADLPVREPMLVEHPTGALFVSGFAGEKATLWTSADRGKTWSAVNAESTAAGLLGNSDVDLAVAPDGTLYWANMTFISQAREGVQIAVAVSLDAGATWAWSSISKRRFDDRPWVKVAPDGTAHIIWNDGSGVWHVVSRDRGTTWSDARRVHSSGGSSHLAIGPAGEVAVRVTPRSASGTTFHQGVDLIAVSVDRGATWAKYPAPGEREWHAKSAVALRRWVEPIAWDARGRLYSAWTTPDAIWLAQSDDAGATWAQWRVVEGGPTRYYPYLTARGRGEVALTWFSGEGDGLHAHLGVVRVAEGKRRPELVGTVQFRPDSWRRRTVNGDEFVRDPAGEYVPAAFLRDGSIAVVSAIHNERTGRRGFTWWRFQLRQ